MKNFELANGEVAAGAMKGVINGATEFAHSMYGSAADVVEVDVELCFKKQSKQRQFVVKDYFQAGKGHNNEASAEVTAAYACRVYERVKASGLPTYTTYRQEKEGASIMMNSLNTDTVTALSHQDPPAIWTEGAEGAQRIHEISNFQDFLHETFQCEEIARKNGVRLGPDAYFALAKEHSGVFECHPFIGDFEGVDLEEDFLDTPNTEPDVGAKEFVRDIITLYVLPEKQLEYLLQLKTVFI